MDDLEKVPHRKYKFKVVLRDDDERFEFVGVEGKGGAGNELDILKNVQKVISGKACEINVYGEILQEDKLAVAVVGSRKMSDYGRQACSFIVEELVAAGVTIVSGLMYGVDLQAHKTALSAGGRTIAVLGYGINHLKKIGYAKPVVESILKGNRGAIISEFPSYESPKSWTFPRRNRLVAGLAKATVIIEADEKSGSLITAGLSLEQGKEVFVVPGSIFSPVSKGKHSLIKDGAILIDSADDVLHYLGVTPRPTKDQMPKGLPKNEQILFDLLVAESTPLSVDDLVLMTSFSSIETSIILTSLELKGLVCKKSYGRWIAQMY